ncbi:MAG: hypothetical protein AB7L71_19505 [Vicinamibacterales bacterium]
MRGLAALLSLVGCLGASTFGSRSIVAATPWVDTHVLHFNVGTPLARWALPPTLREVSGLAVTRDGHVIAHNDEDGRLVEIDHRSGAVTRQWTLGSPRLRGDFEGVDVADTTVTVMRSDGHLFSGRLPDGGGPIVIDRRVSPSRAAGCEFEGLAWSRAVGWLMPCKRTTHGTNRSMFRIQTIPSDADAATSWITYSTTRGPTRMRPSSVTTVQTGQGEVLIVAFGPEHAIGAFTLDGTTLALYAWPASRHPQPEGVAVDGDRLLVADEGAGQRPGVLTVYGRAR